MNKWKRTRKFCSVSSIFLLKDEYLYMIFKNPIRLLPPDGRD
jgi:hypothetical protein